MRMRTTWNQNGSPEVRNQSKARSADVYTMNQEHPQPSATEYVNGSPSDWAEDPTDNKQVQDEYDGDPSGDGHVKRNDVGFGDFRSDTFKHKDSDKWNGPGKYDNRRAAERKAGLAKKIADRLHQSSASNVDDTAVDFMTLSEKQLMAIDARIRSSSVDTLSDQARLRRSLACAKLAYRTLGEGAKPEQVESLGRLYASLDDKTLRSMLSIAAAVPVLAADESDESGDSGESDDKPETSAKKSDDKSDKKLDPKSVHEASSEEDEEEDDDGDGGGSTAASGEEEESDLENSINALMAEEGCEQEACEQESNDFDSLFTDAPPPPPPAAAQQVPTAQPAPVMTNPPSVASSDIDISFDDDDSDNDNHSFASNNEVASLFDDDEEVVNQRKLVASENEYKSRQASAKAGSRGAKKIGNISRPKTNTDADELSTLFDD